MMKDWKGIRIRSVFCCCSPRRQGAQRLERQQTDGQRRDVKGTRWVSCQGKPTRRSGLPAGKPKSGQVLCAELSAALHIVASRRLLQRSVTHTCELTALRARAPWRQAAYISPRGCSV
jgi:hypothetical protein